MDNENSIPILPLPEIIGGEDWEIRESPDGRMAYVDFDKKEMCVPFDEGPKSELLRAHEAMHVAITPRNKLATLTGVQNRTVQACEDARVNFALHKAKIDHSDTQVWGAEEYETLNSPIVSPLEAARSYVATIGTGDNKPIRTILDNTNPGLADEVDKFYKESFGKSEEIPTWDEMIEVAKAFETSFIDWELPELPPSGGSGGDNDDYSDGEKEASQVIGDGKPTDQKTSKVKAPEDKKDKDDSGAGKEKKKKEPPKDTPNVDPRKPFKPGTDGGGMVYDPELPSMTKKEEAEAKAAGIQVWDATYGTVPGKMTIEMPPRTKPYRPKKNRKRAAVEAGAIPKYLHRYTSDMRVFGEKRLKSNSTAVLIDCSGSMALKKEDIEFILEECPSSIIATYSGNQYSGTLTVIAENRMMVADPLMNMKAGNIVDVPALEWLSKRKEDRKIWISDGCITGRNDDMLNPKSVRMATNYIKKGKIIRVNHLNDLRKSNLLRYDPKAFLYYHAAEEITDDGYDINGWGCSICDKPNCSWWSKYKRLWLSGNKAAARRFARSG